MKVFGYLCEEEEEEEGCLLLREVQGSCLRRRHSTNAPQGTHSTLPLVGSGGKGLL